MEVVQVQPRDIYIHYVYVPDAGTTIRWWFSTKRKNIAFGLYRTFNQTQVSSSDVLFHAQDTARPSAQSPQSTRSLNAHSANTLSTANNSSARRPTMSHEASSYSSDNQESSNQQSSAASVRSRRKSVATQKLADNLVEILPIEHCNSADNKVSGHYLVDEPGSYALVFGMWFPCLLGGGWIARY